MTNHTADGFIQELKQHQNEAEIEKMKKFFKDSDENTECLGLKMRTVFQTAKKFIDMPLTEIERLLESNYYEVRMGAVSIMDFQAKAKKQTDDHKQALYELYIRRHDRINNWDFVDRAAPSVIGSYLLDKSKDQLYEMAKSPNIWERRTAIVCTLSFIKAGNTEDTFAIAEILVNDPEELINKAVGGLIREAGKKDEDQLKSFLNKHASTMPRITLRYAIEKFDKTTRDHYLNFKKVND
ncbi:DNA alkylation repair protein [Gracilibacillus alcaliphilus]|uniref:DNA alkylation repair protein n=1 Tax=Gracilibacillus alcaliphilus TaxID=1401441 RepID=UPI00195B99E2|nr:DNA alkylation repair protein [Gracilibacillus alcaliphilus]MBM7676871.1 3-methyladenine DNA glycosylase AlkD [Gracilibacillus alcaliphilus]